MMSNPTSMLQQRQRLHRRQNSTPVALEALKVPNLSNGLQRQNSHRRGQSLDQRSPRRVQNRQLASTVSSTNQGSPTNGQHILREAQRQNLARPGQQTHSPISPRCDIPPSTGANNQMYDTTLETFLQEQASLQTSSPIQPCFSPGIYMPSSVGIQGIHSDLEENSRGYFHSTDDFQSAFANGALIERSMSQPDLQLNAQQRPITPAQQMNSAHLPLTPATTPFNPSADHKVFPWATQLSPIKKMNPHGIYSPSPVPMQRGRSLEGIMESTDREIDIPSPPGTAPLIPSSSFEIAEMPLPQSMISQALPTAVGSNSHHHSQSQNSAQLADSPLGFSSVMDARSPLFGEIRKDRLHLDTTVPILPSSLPGTSCSSPTKTELSPRRMSISDLNLEPGVSASIEETNVTLDDIAMFIEGPENGNNKWTCKYEGCNKRFGRKENIKSHVQTHLGDRQFKCDHCNKCFVRGHDLKRHAKIHTGSKPYPCLCGNAFARHDALTRHRQRGNCIGAFEGVVKKVVKKGRPRKHRPEMDDRLDKANRTRQRVEEKEFHYASSTTGSSMSSYGSPPTETMESLSIRGTSPFDNVSLFDMVTQSMDETMGYPPDLFTFTPPASPGYSTGNVPSPRHRSLTPSELTDVPELSGIHPQLLAVIGEDTQHHHQSPPSLCHSSSSPIAEVLSFEFPAAVSGSPLDDSESNYNKAEAKGNEATVMTAGTDFDSFLDFGNMGMESGQDTFFSL